MNDVTITDVADRSGVSLRTVSRVINGSSKVNPETRRRVEAVIESLGFRPSARARALATGRSFLIGLIHDDPNAQVLDPVQRGLTEICGAMGFEVVVHPCCYGSEQLLDDVRSFIRRSRVDGVVVLPPLAELSQLHQVIAETATPSVSIASIPIAGADMLVSMERQAVQILTRRLIEMGHRRIGFISGPSRFISAQQRRLGFLDALAESGLSPTVMSEGDYSFESGIAFGRSLLDLPDPPTAVFASNDFMAAGVLKALSERGLSSPGHLSVAGFDDSSIAQMISPALTTINRPMRAMAQTAAKRLLARIGAEEGEPSIQTAPDEITLELVERESTAPPSR
ncbi:LacI family DNA-binding transcriptional regulator [Caulobacter segnis]|uniref:LacI family DNA-binding transcriptional regulator n=1 Tax=Caulobacter segnis TaxID=88688 RepID=UPI00240F0F03|nr:LacI family DNA-binding transcriptional regulator [Caulobacter segnis]MDG2522111.1 LacI family DNA-binding transcriptional regulator [Caulobacter segnis]